MGLNGVGSIEDSMTREREILDAWRALRKNAPA
jgi:hypothetical protein